MGELKMAVPLADGSEMLVAVDPRDVPEDLVLEKITPTVHAVSEWVRARSSDECGVEFGLKLGGETDVIVTKGTAEVNFVVTLTWKKP
jgi:Trypsin-co-occurring domain 1